MKPVARLLAPAAALALLAACLAIPACAACEEPYTIVQPPRTVESAMAVLEPVAVVAQFDPTTLPMPSNPPGVPRGVDIDGDGIADTTLPPGTPWWAVSLAMLFPFIFGLFPQLRGIRTYLALGIVALAAGAAAYTTGTANTIPAVLMAGLAPILAFMNAGQKRVEAKVEAVKAAQ